MAEGSGGLDPGPGGQALRANEIEIKGIGAFGAGGLGLDLDLGGQALWTGPFIFL